MKLHKMLELCFTASAPSHSFAQVELNAEFSCQGKNWRVKGFYDGNDTYKVRFTPELTGNWTWKVWGLVNDCGEFSVEADENYHGRVKTQGHHFVYADGKRYLPFGTTVYALAHQPDALVEQTLDTLSKAPFDKVRMCVFPKHYDFNKNEPPCFPFEKKEDGSWNVHKPNIAFWHRFEGFLDRLEEMEIQVDLILFHPYDRWGFSRMPKEDNFVYLDTVIRRLAARPNIWWSLANEYDLMYGWELEDWYAVEEYLVANDPFGNLLSNHNCLATYDYSRPNVTHVCYQSRLVAMVPMLLQKYEKPVIFDEMCYEGNIIHEWGNISGFEMTNRFWQVCVAGGYGTHGDTFMDENSILWWASGGILKGQSAPRIGFLRQILESLPGNLEPLPQMGGGRFMEVSQDKMDQLEQIKEQMPFAYLFGRSAMRMSPEERLAFALFSASYAGHCGDDVILIYHARTCPVVGYMELPEGGSYRVEAIDVWEMTRSTVLENACGKVEFPLPGKEGIAVLAIRNP